MTTATYPLAIVAGLSLATALTSCAADTAPVSNATYTDGTYTESGDYQAPSGSESVKVTLTLSKNIITDVTVVGDATDPQAQLHQGEFASGIAAVVVGKNLNEISVDKVGGSSLTSGGFNAAVTAIKADAAE